MISVLCPTRGRPERFAASMDSFYQTTLAFTESLSPAENCEVLARFDKEDPTADDYGDLWFLEMLEGERHGYEQLHLYYNELAELATGDYLLLWNDDARMVTRGWNEQVAKLDPTVPFVATPGGGDHPFPLISRALYETLGHFSLAPHCDTWLCEIGKAAGCMVSVDYEIEHLRDELDDETKRDGERAQREVTLPLMETEEVKRLLAEDVDRVRLALVLDRARREVSA